MNWARRLPLRWLTAAYVVTQFVMFAIDQPLRTDEAPRGIVSLQVAGTEERASEIIDSWRAEDALDAAGFSTGFDYVFMVAYGLMLAALCVRLGDRRRDRLGIAAAWAAIGGAVFDAIENAFSVFLIDDPSDGLAAAVRACASVKFVLLLAAVAYLLVGGLLSLARTRSRHPVG